MTDCTVNGNTNGSNGSGGGIYNYSGSDLPSEVTLTNCTISGNESGWGGGGIYNDQGGEAATITMTNCTVSGNNLNDSWTIGGGIYNYQGTTTLIDCTISENQASGADAGSAGGGYYLQDGTLNIKNTIIANNTGQSGSTDDYYYWSGTLTDNGYNIVEYQSGASTGSGKTFTAITDILYNTKANGTSSTSWNRNNTALVNQNLNLSSTLANNGGPTQTLAISSGSFAMESGVWDASVTTDQRGEPRHSSPTIGAYEPSYGQSWTGSTSSDWNTAANWQPSVLPVSQDDITIPDVVSDPQINEVPGSPATCNNLTLNSDASLTINAGKALSVEGNLTIAASKAAATMTVNSDATGTGSLIVLGTSTGNITFQRYADVYAKGSKWHYVSSPVVGQSIDNTFMTSNSIYSPNAGTNYNFYRWDEVTNYWIIYGSGGPPVAFGDTEFAAARGYALSRSSDGVISFSGTIRTSDLNYVTTHTAGEGDGFNLVGNPFTSSIGVTSSATTTGKFLATNTVLLDDSYEALYIWDEQPGYSNDRNDYKVISNSGISGYTSINQHYISPGQAFMVKVVSGGGNLAFNENMQAHNNAIFYKEDKEVWPSVELIVENDELFNSTSIGFNENMKKGLDPSYDVGKLKGNPNIALYSKLVENNGVDFAIQALPYFEQDYSVKVGLDIVNAGEYTFKAATMEQIPEEVYVYFEDNITGTVTNLKETDNYTCVISEAGSITDRFILHFTLTPFSTDEINANHSNIQIWSSNKTINILNPENLKGQIRIINMYGQKLIETRLNGNERQQITISIPTGNYIVNIVDNSFSVSKKIFVK
jgi:hypothetical protein